jgi:hypothetical protein
LIDAKCARAALENWTVWGEWCECRTWREVFSLIGILFAPKPGEETQNVQKKVRDLQERAEDAVERGKEVVTEKKEEIAAAVYLGARPTSERNRDGHVGAVVIYASPPSSPGPNIQGCHSSSSAWMSQNHLSHVGQCTVAGLLHSSLLRDSP